MTDDAFDPRSAARRSAFAAVGAGVLAFQKVQVFRREVQREFDRLEPDQITTHDPESLDGQLDRIEAKVDVAVEAVERRLPTPAAIVVGQVWETTKDGSAQVRSLLGRPPGRSA